ncbi:hypothetical protein AB0N89_10910 [Amycolatopsis sp. NPDC089917]|uniref:hypothetical protein n=1 Tax=Amycolatopsis sp. NPDC089917 TaxID=3155187 RepID=UPI0034316889
MSDPERADQLVQQIGGAVLREAPEGWRRIDVKATMATMVEDLAITVIMADGSSAQVQPPDVAAALRESRQALYEPGKGTWLAMRLILDPPGSFVVHYNFDFDPLWDPPVPAVVYQRDLEAFPRDEEKIPAWYRARMEEQQEEADQT